MLETRIVGEFVSEKEAIAKIVELNTKNNTCGDYYIHLMSTKEHCFAAEFTNPRGAFGYVLFERFWVKNSAEWIKEANVHGI